jgi:endonuclease V-like protein UPF0215 family
LRVVGVDGGTLPAKKQRGQRALLVAVLLENLQLRDVRFARIEVDGRDMNKVLTSLLRGLSFDAVILSGISFAGFNLVDISQLGRMIRRPVIAVTGEKPDNQAVKRALKAHFEDWGERWRKVLAAGTLYSCRPLPEEPRLYFEVRGASPRTAQKIIKLTAVISRLPEPVRVAGLLAKGFSSL